MVKLTDVAAKAGCSVTTVSRVITAILVKKHVKKFMKQ